jgi:hypothetical protein
MTRRDKEEISNMANNFRDEYKERWRNRFDDIWKALTSIQRELEMYPEEDWRASMAWEAATNAEDVLILQLFDATELPARPDNYKVKHKSVDVL